MGSKDKSNGSTRGAVVAATSAAAAAAGTTPRPKPSGNAKRQPVTHTKPKNDGSVEDSISDQDENNQDEQEQPLSKVKDGRVKKIDIQYKAKRGAIPIEVPSSKQELSDAELAKYFAQRQRGVSKSQTAVHEPVDPEPMDAEPVDPNPVVPVTAVKQEPGPGADASTASSHDSSTLAINRPRLYCQMFLLLDGLATRASWLDYMKEYMLIMGIFGGVIEKFKEYWSDARTQLRDKAGRVIRGILLLESSAKGASALKEGKIDVAQEKKNLIARTKDIKTLNDTTFLSWVRAIVGTSSTKLTEFNPLFSVFVREFLFTSGGPKFKMGHALVGILQSRAARTRQANIDLADGDQELDSVSDSHAPDHDLVANNAVLIVATLLVLATPHFAVALGRTDLQVAVTAAPILDQMYIKLIKGAKCDSKDAQAVHEIIRSSMVVCVQSQINEYLGVDDDSDIGGGW